MAKPVTPPPGGREVKTSGFNFWNPTKKGDYIYGTLAGSTHIKNQRGEDRERWVIVTGDKENNTKVLPDHLNLDRAMRDVVSKSGFASRVWIEFEGKKPVEGVAQPMAFYRVIDYGSPKEK